MLWHKRWIWASAIGGAMGFVTDFLGGINFEAIIQLTMLAAIMIAGPIVIFLLAARGGDL